MKYIVYCTTCTKNGKIYIGVHKTENPEVFDGYIGNGLKIGYSIKNTKNAFQRAVKKYGYSSFKRSILFIYDNEIDAYNKEAEIVNFDFIKRRDNYNTSIGGIFSGKQYKYIYQYDLNGNFIKEWFSVSDTCAFFNCYPQRISQAIKNKKSFNNCFWSFQKYDKLNVDNYRLSYHPGIYQYDLQGNQIEYFISLKEIQNKYKISKKNLNYIINSKSIYNNSYFVDPSVNIIDIIKTRELYGNITDKCISKYNNGKLVQTYPNISRAARDNHMASSTIRKSIKNKEGVWAFGYSEYFIDRSTPICTKILQYDLEGNFIKEWPSMSSCLKEFPKAKEVILKKRNKTKGFIFKIN